MMMCIQVYNKDVSKRFVILLQVMMMIMMMRQ
jgi:hypothetical protein